MHGRRFLPSLSRPVTLFTAPKGRPKLSDSLTKSSKHCRYRSQISMTQMSAYSPPALYPQSLSGKAMPLPRGAHVSANLRALFRLPHRITTNSHFRLTLHGIAIGRLKKSAKRSTAESVGVLSPSSQATLPNVQRSTKSRWNCISRSPLTYVTPKMRCSISVLMFFFFPCSNLSSSHCYSREKHMSAPLVIRYQDSPPKSLYGRCTAEVCFFGTAAYTNRKLHGPRRNGQISPSMRGGKCRLYRTP